MSTVKMSAVINIPSVVLLSLFWPFVLSLQNDSTQVAPPDNVTELVKETLRFIKQGDDMIQLNEHHKDIILVIGNTGAGKTTLTKFLALTDHLQAYIDSDGSILIRDIKEGKISEISTVVSKTQFPDLIIDPTTHTAFYDLPGFKDTRNPAVEISNAWFMRKVAKHARSVKFLCIVRHESLRKGGSRDDFLSFLKHAIQFIKSPRKYQESIGLVASKMEQKKTTLVVPGVVAFLKSVKSDLKTVIQDEDKRVKVGEFLDALDQTGPDGDHNRISFFVQPTEPGMLLNMSEVMIQKEHMQKVIYQNTRYTNSSVEDFGIPLSDRAKLVVERLIPTLLDIITNQVDIIGNKIQVTLLADVKKDPVHTLGSHLKKHQRLENIIANIPNAGSRSEFFHKMNEYFLTVFPDRGEIQEQLELITKREENLRFLEDVMNSNVQAPLPKDWVASFQKVFTIYGQAIVEKARSVNEHIRDKMTKFGQILRDNIDDRKKTFGTNLEGLSKEYAALISAVTNLKQALYTSTSINNFIQNIQTRTPSLKLTLRDAMEQMSIDISFSDATIDKNVLGAFHNLSWIKPVEDALHYLKEKKANIEDEIRQAEHDEKIQKLQEDAMRLNDTFQQHIDDQRKENEKKMKELIDASKKSLEQEVTALNEERMSKQALEQELTKLKDKIRSQASSASSIGVDSFLVLVSQIIGGVATAFISRWTMQE